MSRWTEQATWDDLIGELVDPQNEGSLRYREAVDEIRRRAPNLSDYRRIVTERLQVGGPLGSRPNWEPSWTDDAATQTWLVRLLSNDGQYPVEAIINDAGILAADNEIAWAAVYWNQEHPDDRAPISWLRMDEVCFFGAISLAEGHPRTNGRPRIYTRSRPERLHLKETATFEDVHRRSREIALRIRADSIETLIPEHRSKPRLLEQDYNDQVEVLLRAMYAEESAVLLRGLYKFLMATEMFQHHPFLEEMALSAIISREACLELLRRKFSTQTGKRLKKEGVIDRIRAEFPTGQPFTQVLGWDWENRVMMVHPVSDHGEFWSPPVEVEECYDTLNSLVYLYRYLLLDEVWVPGKYD